MSKRSNYVNQGNADGQNLDNSKGDGNVLDDVEFCRQIMQLLIEDQKLQKLYNEYRFSKGFDVIDFQKQSELDQQQLKIFIDCLNDTFASKNANGADN